jgi:hypothetical protein
VTRCSQHLVGLPLCFFVFVFGSVRYDSMLAPLWVLFIGTMFGLGLLGVYVLFMFFAYTDTNRHVPWMIAAYALIAAYWAFLMSGLLDLHP